MQGASAWLFPSDCAETKHTLYRILTEPKYSLLKASIALAWQLAIEPQRTIMIRDTASGGRTASCTAAPFTFDESILVVLPTYNERANLEALVTAIGQYLVTDIVIVDDNSPDGTGELADQLSTHHPHVHVLHRPRKEGLGPAYIAGFQWALQRPYDRIIEMDCDFSHPPWDLPRLVHRSHTADLVINSRYVPGGGTENWNARRRPVSRCGNTYVRLFLGSIIQDWTEGFRCYRRGLLERMALSTVQAKGYIFQVELAWRAVQLGAEVSELPIRFSDRVLGQSKLGWPSIIEGLMEVPKMYLRGSTGQ